MKVKDRVDESLRIVEMIALNLQDRNHNWFYRNHKNRKIIGEHLHEQVSVIERYIRALELNNDMAKQVSFIQDLDDEVKTQKLMFHMLSCVSEFLNDDTTLIKRAREEGYYE